MPRRQRAFAKLETGFVKSDSRFRALRPADRAWYIELWCEAKRQFHEVIELHPTWVECLAREWRCTRKIARGIVERIARAGVAEPRGSLGAPSEDPPGTLPVPSASVRGSSPEGIAAPDPLVVIISPTQLRICGCSKVHGSDTKGNIVVFPDVDVDVDKDPDVPSGNTGVSQRPSFHEDDMRRTTHGNDKSTFYVGGSVHIPETEEEMPRQNADGSWDRPLVSGLNLGSFGPVEEKT